MVTVPLEPKSKHKLPGGTIASRSNLLSIIQTFEKRGRGWQRNYSYLFDTPQHSVQDDYNLLKLNPGEEMTFMKAAEKLMNENDDDKELLAEVFLRMKSRYRLEVTNIEKPFQDWCVTPPK